MAAPLQCGAGSRRTGMPGPSDGEGEPGVSRILCRETQEGAFCRSEGRVIRGGRTRHLRCRARIRRGAAWRTPDAAPTHPRLPEPPSSRRKDRRCPSLRYATRSASSCGSSWERLGPSPLVDGSEAEGNHGQGDCGDEGGRRGGLPPSPTSEGETARYRAVFRAAPPAPGRTASEETASTKTPAGTQGLLSVSRVSCAVWEFPAR